MNKILVTGGTGMVGSAIHQVLGDRGVYIGTKTCDFRNLKDTVTLIKQQQPSAIIHLAARVGGVKENQDNMGEFFYENMKINLNVLHAAHLAGVPKLVSLLSTCVFPDQTNYPLFEKNIHNGEPHSTNFGYAYAKRMLDVQSRAYRCQYGSNFITAIPNNLYGENDNFHLTKGHVIPAMIRKIHEANLNRDDKVEMWGDGSPLREFTHSTDIARILLFLLDHYNDPEPINIGDTREISIKDVATMVANILDYRGEINWNQNFPNGQSRKPSNNDKLHSLGWTTNNYIPLAEGLVETCKWFKEQYPDVRGARI